jgi:hypothetical protein
VIHIVVIVLIIVAVGAVSFMAGVRHAKQVTSAEAAAKTVASDVKKAL